MTRLKLILFGLLALSLVGLGVAAAFVRFDYAYVPDRASVLNAERLPTVAAFDVMGRSVPAAEAEALLRTEAGRALLSPANGAVLIDAALIESGRRDFYGETFGSESFLTDVLGMLEGGLTATRIALALAELGGRGTDNLEVRLARDVTVGTRTLRAGDLVSTGLDVPKGGYLPLGVRVFYDGGRLKVGVTCALCHASVEPRTGRVVEGAPNTNLNIGLILALASNPASYLAHTGLGSLDPYLTKPDNIVRTSKGPNAVLPEPDALARDVRAMLAAWPPGSFDSTPDRVNNPTSIPSAFTAHAHPYGWSGHAALGPFRGLWALRHTTHGLQADPSALAAAAPTLFGVDPEVYLGTLLQGAAAPWLRFDPRDGSMPSEILDDIETDGDALGANRSAVMPSYPRANYLSTGGLVSSKVSDPAITTADRLGADGLPAFQNGLRPPAGPAADPAAVARGRAVFERAGCLACHSGPALSSNRVWPASVIGTEPSRAAAFAPFEPGVAAPQVFATGTPVPPPENVRLVEVPVPDEGQLKLAWGHNRTGGGYKVPGLIGLLWSAPYLHDGGVAVGPDPNRKAGIDATVRAGVAPDPANSLRALVDRGRRAPVIAANRASPEVRLARVTGEGHAFWVDGPAGYADEDRDALVAYLLSFDRPEFPAPAR